MKRPLSFIPLLMLLAMGCSPYLQAPQVTARSNYLYGEEFSKDSISLPSSWWQLFGDTTLNRLVEKALNHNRNLRLAASRVEEARQMLTVARAEYLPTVGAALSAEGNYNHSTKITQQYAAEMTASWEIPLFGELKATNDEALASLGASIWSYRGVALSLTAEVATTYFTLLQYRRDLWIANRTGTLRRESAALIDSLFSYGMATGVDREQAQALVFSAEADIPRYRSAIEQTELALATLTGEPPQPVTQEGVGLELLLDHLPEGISIGVPSELLQRRPDILQARFALDQAAAEAKLSRLDRFPSITLTAKAGAGSTSIKGLTSSNPAVWNAVAALTQPIFNFGAQKRRERAAVERYRQAAYTYEQTILEAFADVEKILSSIRATELETERYTRLVISYRSILDMAGALYRNGMADYLDVIDAERTLYTAQTELIALLSTQYINYVTLCKALGGGWQATTNTHK